MEKTIAEINKERKELAGTLKNKYSDFKVGDRVKIICVAQDMNFFNDGMEGEVINNNHGYLGIEVKFTKGDRRNGTFHFEPEDLLKIEPLERIPEETRPTGEKGLKKEFSDMLLHYIDKDIEEIDLWKWIQEQLSLAREEGKEEQAELDRKIYGMSVEEFSKNYKVVEPLQNGEREDWEEEIRDLMFMDRKELLYSERHPERKEPYSNYFENEAINKVKDLLSQSKKECIFTKKELSYLSWAMNAERFGEDMVGRRPNTSAENHDILNEKINKELESLTNQKKDI